MKTTLAEFLQLGLGLLILLVVNAGLVACETALVKLRYSDGAAIDLPRIRSRKRLVYMMDKAAGIAPVIRFGIVAATIGLGGLLFPLLSLGLMQIPLLDVAPGRTIAAILGFVIAVTLIRLLGFLAPRALALAYPEQTLRWSSWFVLAVVAIIKPWFDFLQRLISRLLKALNLPVSLDFNVLDVEVQLKALSGGRLQQSTPYLRGLVTNTLRLRELEVSDVLLPRNQVQYLDADRPLADNLARARRTRHTRFPLCHGDLDHCVGIIHIKDVFIAQGAGAANAPATDERAVAIDERAVDLMQLRRKLVIFRASTPVETALQTLLEHKVHMALVRDDFGGTLGVITLDSILEEIVGEIIDEFDTPVQAPIVRYADNRYRIEGLTPIHDVESALNIVIDSGEVSTFGGLVSERLGRIPQQGETLLLEDLGLSVTADSVDERRLISALVEIRRQPSEANEV